MGVVRVMMGVVESDGGVVEGDGDCRRWGGGGG